MSTAAIRRYWSALTRTGCVLCMGPAEIAHCHGGSIVERMQEPKAKGVKLARLDWLVLPLCPPHHRAEYVTGLDRNVNAWESVYGEQAEWIDRTNFRRTGVDPWPKAREGMKQIPQRAA